MANAHVCSGWTGKKSISHSHFFAVRLLLLADTRNPNARERERERESEGGERRRGRKIRKEVNPAKILRLVITADLLRYETLRRILNRKRTHARVNEFLRQLTSRLLNRDKIRCFYLLVKWRFNEINCT